MGAIAATFLVAATLRLQSKELHLQRQELTETRAELKRQADAAEKQEEAIERQRRATLLAAAMSGAIAEREFIDRRREFELRGGSTRGQERASKLAAELVGTENRIGVLRKMILADLQSRVDRATPQPADAPSSPDDLPPEQA